MRGGCPIKILVVNDDSISALGIVALAQAAAKFGEVTVVAPSEQCSALSQKITLRETMVLKKYDRFPAPASGAWELSGTPVDCVKVALCRILEDRPDWVFSGINNGYNVGFDIAYSGTLGAAFEASRAGIPAIAFSIAGDKHLSAVEPYLTDVIRELIGIHPGKDKVWNVNFPPLATRTFQGVLRDRSVAQVSMYREEYLEERLPDGSSVLTCHGIPTPDKEIEEGSDAAAVRSGYISIGKARR